MNKRSLFKLILIIIATIMSCYCVSIESNNIIDDIYVNIGVILIAFFFIILPITMYQEMDKIKKPKIKFIYDVILMLLTVGACCIILFVSINVISYFMDININYENLSIMYYSFFPLIFTLALLSAFDLKRKTNKLNDILTIITSLVIILIHIRYFIDSNLDVGIAYIYQNYIYFIILLITTIIHKFISKEKQS